MPPEEAVRPCLRCDSLVEESRAFCPSCGNYLSPVRLIVPRPAAVSSEGSSDAGIGRLRLAVSLALVLLAAAAIGFAIAGAA